MFSVECAGDVALWPLQKLFSEHLEKCSHSGLIGRFTLGTITNFNPNFMTLVIKFSLQIQLDPNLLKRPDIEV